MISLHVVYPNPFWGKRIAKERENPSETLDNWGLEIEFRGPHFLHKKEVRKFLGLPEDSEVRSYSQGRIQFQAHDKIAVYASNENQLSESLEEFISILTILPLSRIEIKDVVRLLRRHSLRRTPWAKKVKIEGLNEVIEFIKSQPPKISSL